MKKYLKEFLILLVQIFMFYVFPLFGGPTDVMGVIILTIIITFMLAIILGFISLRKIKFLYPLVIAIVFLPSVFIFYNETALIYSIWYFFISLVGVFIGSIVSKILKR